MAENAVLKGRLVDNEVDAAANDKENTALVQVRIVYVAELGMQVMMMELHMLGCTAFEETLRHQQICPCRGFAG